MLAILGKKVASIHDEHAVQLWTGNPSWLVVDPSAADAKKLLVPANDVRVSGERLSVPYAKERVARAPLVEAAEAPTEHEQTTLCRYYGLVHPASDQAGEGCEEMPDVRPAG